MGVRKWGQLAQAAVKVFWGRGSEEQKRVAVALRWFLAANSRSLLFNWFKW